MRLINTETLEMHEFLPADIPRYAILSHRWQEEEVSFKQYTKRHKYPEVQQLKGFAKIEQFCRIARERQMQWAWIDTCCIDSRSSAELSEAINSMWRWYEDAEECYIYLCDVHMQDDFSDLLAQVERSEWFTRGWTLQELIAPGYRVFFTSRWAEIGNIKSVQDWTRYEDIGSCFFLSSISRASGVPIPYLLGRNLGLSSIGERISWAASRQTSRPEDVAYSLMGLLNVNMPLLYGEGKEKAFVRLQIELIKKSRDTSLFAWEFTPIDAGGTGLLASSPAPFARFSRSQSHNNDLWRFGNAGGKLLLAPYEMTNEGFHVHVGAYRVHQPPGFCDNCVVWCVPLSENGHAIFLLQLAAKDLKSSKISASRMSLIGDYHTNRSDMFHLNGAKRALSLKEDLDGDRSIVHLDEGQRGKPESCEFYVRQDYL
ncbi:hypothetical protein D0863_05529 [Hortaea werneckii]|uniref:Heterokaryon incompatibility domain-containing protein n=1 Tax=Hortaea werneckii TaxID=91943 RepID=A0A3M7E2E2_HORWE|nr:hypothetical protein D0863_05529 [Hortaea werneckii]